MAAIMASDDLVLSASPTHRRAMMMACTIAIEIRIISGIPFSLPILSIVSIRTSPNHAVTTPYPLDEPDWSERDEEKLSRGYRRKDQRKLIAKADVVLEDDREVIANGAKMR